MEPRCSKDAGQQGYTMTAQGSEISTFLWAHEEWRKISGGHMLRAWLKPSKKDLWDDPYVHTHFLGITGTGGEVEIEPARWGAGGAGVAPAPLLHVLWANAALSGTPCREEGMAALWTSWKREITGQQSISPELVWHSHLCKNTCGFLCLWRPQSLVLWCFSPSWISPVTLFWSPLTSSPQDGKQSNFRGHAVQAPILIVTLGKITSPFQASVSTSV